MANTPFARPLSLKFLCSLMADNAVQMMYETIIPAKHVMNKVLLLMNRTNPINAVPITKLWIIKHPLLCNCLSLSVFADGFDIEFETEPGLNPGNFDFVSDKLPRVFPSLSPESS